MMRMPLWIGIVLPLIVPALASSADAGTQERGRVVTLDEALSLADERNLDLKAAREGLKAAREASRQAWSRYLPQVSVGGNYTYHSSEASLAFPAGFLVRDVGFDVGPEFNPDFDEDEPIGPDNMPGFPTSYVVVPYEMIEAEVQRRHQLGGQLQVNQALVVPSLWPAIRAAYLGAEIAELGVENAREEILFAVAQIYYGAAGLREAVALQEEMVEVASEHVRHAELRVEQGSAPRVEVLRARIEYTKAQQDLVRTRNSYDGMLSSLAALLDVEPTFEVEEPAPLKPPADEFEDDGALLAGALDSRPDVLSARLSVDASEQSRRAVRNRYFPTVGLTGTYQLTNVEGFTGDRDSWFVGVGLSWNLFDGGLRESELREASARLAESRVRARATQARVEDEIRRAILDLESARANVVKAEQQASLARENVELVRTGFEAGVTTSLEMVDANAALRAAELARINEKLNEELALLTMLRATGRFFDGY